MENNCKDCKHCDKEIEIIKKYKNKSDLIKCLQDVQNTMGYIPERVTVLIAKQLNVPESDIYSVITFYKQFSLRPKAKYSIEVCMGTACYVLGAAKLVEEIKKQLKMGDKKWTDDGKFELVDCRCLGCCGIAPAVSINGKLYGHVKTEEIAKILSECE